MRRIIKHVCFLFSALGGRHEIFTTRRVFLSCGLLEFTECWKCSQLSWKQLKAEEGHQERRRRAPQNRDLTAQCKRDRNRKLSHQFSSVSIHKTRGKPCPRKKKVACFLLYEQKKNFCFDGVIKSFSSRCRKFRYKPKEVKGTWEEREGERFNTTQRKTGTVVTLLFLC